MLSTIDRGVISNIMSRQAGRSVLAHQIEYVNELVQEGLMSPKDSEIFLDLAQADMDSLEARVRREFRYLTHQILTLTLLQRTCEDHPIQTN